MKIDITSNIPLYKQLKQIIKKKIESGKWAEGELIPTEKELVEKYKVSRITVRKALNELTKENYIRKRAGYGTIVYQNKANLFNFTQIQSFTNEMNEMGRKNQTLYADLTKISADEELAEIFGIDEGKEVYRFIRLRGLNDEIVVYSETYLLDIVNIPNDEDVLLGSLYEFLSKNGIVFSKFSEIISATIAPKQIGEMLKTEDGHVHLKRIRYGYDSNEKLIEYTINYYNSYLYEYRIDIHHNKN